MKLIITDDKLEIELSKAINSGSINYYNIECEFNSAWNNLTKEIILKSNNNAVKRVVVDGIVNIDQRIKGIYQIGARGYSIIYKLTTDTVVDTKKTYYTRSGTEGSYIYTKVENPTQAGLSTYYEAEKTLQISTGLKRIPVNEGAGEIETQDEEITTSEFESYVSQIQQVIERTERLNVTGQRVLDGVEITFTDRNGVETVKKVDDGEQGPKGDTGNSGVYVGPTQPTDPNVNVWVNTNSTAEEYYTKTETDTKLALKQNITDNTLTTTNKNIVPAINEVNSIAKGANQAIGYANYSTMITAFNSLASTTYRVGQNIYIVTTEVPDLWVSSVESTSSTYTYTTDAQVVSDLTTNGYIQCGYYRLSMLETQKVDLTNYVTNTDYATNNIGGIFKTGDYYGTFVNPINGILSSTTKDYNNYQNGTIGMFISKGTLENVLTARIGSIDSLLDTINGGVI